MKCVLGVFIHKYGDYTHDLTAKWSQTTGGL